MAFFGDEEIPKGMPERIGRAVLVVFAAELPGGYIHTGFGRQKGGPDKDGIEKAQSGKLGPTLDAHPCKELNELHPDMILRPR